MTGRSVLRVGPVSLPVHHRTVVASLLLAIAVLVAGLATLLFPGAGLDTGTVIEVLVGRERGFPAVVVLQWRLPRLIAAIVLGAALAVSGAMFQTLTRNPLGSPDVIGFNAGAYTGAIAVMLSGGSGFAMIAGGALVGGVATALAVYLLALRSGSAGMRLIVVGLGVSAMLAALNRWLLLRADLDASMAAATWGAGTLNGLRAPVVTPAVATVGVLLLLGWLLSRRVDALSLGDDVAAGIGVPLGRTRLALIVVGIGLTAVSTAVAGPIAFVALSAPHIARRLTRGSRVSGVPIALTGALLLTVADLLAQRLFDPQQLPVGVITVVVGGLYLMTLLAREARA